MISFSQISWNWQNLACLIIYSFGGGVTAGDNYSYAVTNPSVSRNNYVHQIIPDFPAEDTTICAWVRLASKPAGDFFGLISIADKDGYSNHLLLSLRPTSSSEEELVIGVHHYYGTEPRFISEWPKTISIKRWSFLCFVADFIQINIDNRSEWTLTLFLMDEDSYGTWKWSDDLTFDTVFLPFNPARDVSLILFNDQDIYGGGLTDGDSIDGTIMCLNIWNSTFGPEDLLLLADCQTEGNTYTLSTSTTTIFGDVEVDVNRTVPGSLQVADGPTGRFHTGEYSVAGQYRLYNDVRVADLNLLITSANSLMECSHICLARSDCYSVNYEGSTSTCELGSLMQSAESAQGSAAGWKYLTLTDVFKLENK